MFDVGFSEMLIIAAIALIAIGPQQLPQIARVVGKFIRDIKNSTNELTSTFKDASKPFEQAINEAHQPFTDARATAEQAFADALTSVKAPTQADESKDQLKILPKSDDK